MKITIICLLILFIPSCLLAGDNMLLKWNIGNFGIGTNYSLDDDDNLELYADALNFKIENKLNGFGLEFSPFRFWEWDSFSGDIPSVKTMSFVNSSLYWNIMNIIYPGQMSDLGILIGPYAAVNYMFWEKHRGINWDQVIFTAGLRLDLSFPVSGDNNVHYKFLGGEVGYRYINGNNKFFAGANVDILALFIVFTVLALSDTGDEEE